MTYLLGVPVEKDSRELLVVEVDEREMSSDLVLASPEPGSTTARAQVALDDALTKLKPSLQKVMGMLKDLSPEAASVEFGLTIGGETGVIIAKGTAEVNFVVRMAWGAAEAVKGLA